MRIETATIDEVRDVAQRMRDRDFEEFAAVSNVETREAMVEQLVQRFGAGGQAICAALDRPIAIGAMVLHRPRVATLMFFATDEFPKIATGLTRWIKWELFPRYREAGVHRIECASIEGYEKTHRWIELLGLHHEAVFPGFGRDGQSFHQFAWVRDVRPSGA